MTAAIVLAVVLGAGAVPIPESVQHFPDPSYWPGTGARQVGNMLQAVADQAGVAMRTSGPGPQQLLERWRTGRLNPAERVSVLLAGGSFHHEALLPIYADALRSTVLRERRAAIVGLAWLIGERPPDPNAIPDTPARWNELAAFADALTRTARRHSLVQVWARSLLAAKGQSPPRGLLLRHTVPECLAAIREIAEPDDLNDLLALWPLLDRGERLNLLKTIEIVTVQRFSDEPANSRAPTGPWLDDVTLGRVDDWVAQSCRTISGTRYAMRSIGRQWRSAEPAPGPQAALLSALDAGYAGMWPVPAELLTAFGGPAVDFDRQWPDDPRNQALARRVRSYFAVSGAEAREGPERAPRRR